jgi:hypothetical protein
MKLPLDIKYFKKMKENQKNKEFRDAHITFICNQTGENLRADVIGVELQSRADTKAQLSPIDDSEFNRMFTDKRQIVFRLRF